jgi:pimeloyl-ACP methyl ester carboxylesterase
VNSCATFTNDGIYPEVQAGLASAFTPEAFVSTPLEADYRAIAPNPDDFSALVLKVKDLTTSFAGWPESDFRSFAAPTLLIAGDADIITPEHVVALFRLRGGGVPGDFAGMPSAQLAILPGTSHTMIMERTGWLGSMIPAFLDAPIPAGG